MVDKPPRRADKNVDLAKPALQAVIRLGLAKKWVVNTMWHGSLFIGITYKLGLFMCERVLPSSGSDL